MQKIIFKSALVLIAALAAPFSPAQDVAPDRLLKEVTLEVIAIIRQDKDIQAGNPAKVAALVETRILPYFDFTRMTQTAMARNWRLANTLSLPLSLDTVGSKNLASYVRQRTAHPAGREIIDVTIAGIVVSLHRAAGIATGADCQAPARRAT